MFVPFRHFYQKIQAGSHLLSFFPLSFPSHLFSGFLTCETCQMAKISFQYSYFRSFKVQSLLIFVVSIHTIYFFQVMSDITLMYPNFISNNMFTPLHFTSNSTPEVRKVEPLGPQHKRKKNHQPGLKTNCITITTMGIHNLHF